MVMVTPSDCMIVGAVRSPVRRPPIGQASVMGTVGIAPGVGVTVAVGVALAERQTWAGLILDGIHVHPVSARAAFAAKSADKLMLVSDAMATVGAKDASMSLFGERIAVSGGALRTEAGTLAGAHLDLAEATRNATTMLNATADEALRMASLSPSAFLGVGGSHGRIAPGARADVVLFSDALTVHKVWIGGAEVA
jgi:N-acetylglucosamine-6-phosphate deacetylase